MFGDAGRYHLPMGVGLVEHVQGRQTASNVSLRPEKSVDFARNTLGIRRGHRGAWVNPFTTCRPVPAFSVPRSHARRLHAAVIV